MCVSSITWNAFLNKIWACASAISLPSSIISVTFSFFTIDATAIPTAILSFYTITFNVLICSLNSFTSYRMRKVSAIATFTAPLTATSIAMSNRLSLSATAIFIASFIVTAYLRSDISTALAIALATESSTWSPGYSIASAKVFSIAASRLTWSLTATKLFWLTSVGNSLDSYLYFLSSALT